jgi:hypothetical protein
MQVSVRRTAGRSMFTLAYTWSHSMDDSSDRYDGNFLDSYNMSRTRASSNFDQRQILNIGYVLDLPGLPQHEDAGRQDLRRLAAFGAHDLADRHALQHHRRQRQRDLHGGGRRQRHRR